MSASTSSRVLRNINNKVTADPPGDASNPSSSASSTRVLPPTHVPNLTTLCARVFVANIRSLARDESVWKAIQLRLKQLPEFMVPKIFAMLRATCPEVLNHAFIVAYFLRGASVTLTDDLPGIRRLTLDRIRDIGPTLSELELSGLAKYNDSVFAALISALPSLKILILRGCTKVGPETLHAAAKVCLLLTVVNLNYTSVTPVSVAPLVKACSRLEVLKIAGISNWTDANFAKFLAALPKDLTLHHMRALKLRQTALSDPSLLAFVSLCPNLERLDLSFTRVRHSSNITSKVPSLNKLSLTSTQISNAEMLRTVSGLPNLRTLALGALGGGRGSSATIANSTAYTMSNDALRDLTDIIESFQHLESVNLVGNSKLGYLSTSDALFQFILRVGRKCKRLNLAGLQGFRASDLAGLQGDTTSSLEELTLKNSNVNDDAASYIRSCEYLRMLDIAGTKFTKEGLFPIIDACTHLESIDVTSCRGIKVTERRQIFEIWEQERSSP